MPDEPKKIFDLMDIETEPTDEQLAELMEYVGQDIRAESARIAARQQKVSLAAEDPSVYGKPSVS